MADATTPDMHGLKPSLTLPMAFCLSLKQVIGGGVIVLTGTAIGLAGAGAAPAYLLACIVVLLVSLPYAVFRDNQNHVVSDNQRHIHRWNPSGLGSRLSGP